jgi:hypothetical protein
MKRKQIIDFGKRNGNAQVFFLKSTCTSISIDSELYTVSHSWITYQKIFTLNTPKTSSISSSYWITIIRS